MKFNPVDFKKDYPQFSDLSDNKLKNDFMHGAMVIGSIVSSIFDNDEDKLYWLSIVLAHILTLEDNEVLGRVSSASQGSDSAKFDMNVKKDYEWWATTIYGQRVMQLLETYGCGGLYLSDGEIPYLG
ncbi:DUF4054 domain-containing protein [Francisella tularensis]|uniref:DUF4054 domain-containing protein n=1 Tax=Francisella tularensis TaxID=263 RepID=UPI0008F4B69E|nr:DUF4054 domain-containing protein [Francisella tularensis]APA83225.1 hypothetical protein N894_1241 [Francisella tularensis subsp. novicida PA10-7858]